MPITGPIPLPGANMETFFKGGEYAQSMIDSMLQNQQKQRALQQQQLEAQQTNQNNLFKQSIEQQKLPGFLELQKQQAANQQAQAGYNSSPLRTDLLQAKIESERSLKEQRNRGGSGSGVGNQNLNALSRQAMLEVPNIDEKQADIIRSAWLSESPTLPDGTPTPPLSGTGQQILKNIQTKNAPAAIQNKAANLDALASHANSIDIEPLKKFTGLPGRIDVGKYTAMMATGQEVPQEFRDYLSFQKVTSNFAMDALRQGFGTSVVPEYVYATLGAAANPNSSWWYDPKQVQNDWNKTKKWINDDAKKYKELAKGSIYNQEKSQKSDLGPSVSNKKQEGNFEVEIYSPEGKVIARGTKKQAAKFLEKHKGHYQKEIK